MERLEGKYEILERISEGGMGAVYLVRHRLLEEVRVVKTVRPQFAGDETLRARFLREARTAVKLRHPNIAQMYDFTMDEDGNAFIVMEYIEGIGLDELLRRIGVPSLGLAMSVARHALAALGHLHRKGLVHRDISPDNLMLTRDDEGAPLVKMIDLGLAKALEENSHLTVAGTFLGKVRYASPEQFRVQEGAAVDHRSDLYSFGVVLYELLTGRHPVRGTTLPTFVSGHLFEPPIPFESSDPQGRIPHPLRSLVLRSLAKAPEDRPQNTAEVLEVLEPIARRNTVSHDELELALTLPDLPTTRIPVGRPGSTQARLDRQFGATTTPAPGLANDQVAPEAIAPPRDAAAEPVADPDLANLSPEPPQPPHPPEPEPGPPPSRPDPVTQQARGLPPPDPAPPAPVHAPSPPPPPPPPPPKTAKPRVRAPAGGIEQPPSSRHEDRREKELRSAAASIEESLARGDIATAAHALEVAERVFRGKGPFAELRRRLTAVQQQQRTGRVNVILADVRRLADAGELTRAISELLEAMVDFPGDPLLEAQLLGFRRREAAAVVLQALAQGDMDAADQALRLAERRFGSDDTLVDLRWRIDALRSNS